MLKKNQWEKYCNCKVGVIALPLYGWGNRHETVQDSLRITQITTGNSQLYCAFPSPPLDAVLLFVPISLVLTEPLEDHGGLAVCHVEIGNEDSVVFDLGCSCPFLPWDWEGAETCLQGLSELQCIPWRNTVPVGFAGLISQVGLHSRLSVTLTPWSMRPPCYSFHLPSLRFLPSNSVAWCDWCKGCDWGTWGKKAKLPQRSGAGS